MTRTLKKQLTALAVVFLSGGALQAQDKGETSVRATLKMDERRTKLTRSDAVKYFVQLLSDIQLDSHSRHAYTEPRFSFAQHGMGGLKLNSFSVKSERDFRRALEPVLKQMANDWWLHPYITQVQTVHSESEKNATISVGFDPKKRSLVLIQEDGGWGVDVFETYALWNDLAGERKTAAFARFASIAKDLDVRAACDSNLQQISLALRQYKEAHDGRLPLATSWMDALKPYLKSEEVLHCPAQSPANSYGYAFNSKLSDKSDLIISAPLGIVPVVAIYETTDSNRNAFGTGEERVFRHSDGANYSIGGSTRWFHKTWEPNFKLKP